MNEPEIFASAMKLFGDARHAFLDAACGQDARRREQIEALLKAHDESGGLLPRQADPLLDETHVVPGQAVPGVVIAGRYKLLEQIGEGGMGTVWVAEQSQPVKRKVALKLIKAGMDSKSVLARFEAERQALAVMDHPNIAKVLDGGLTETGRPYFVMDYVKGVPITEYCDATRLSVPERLQLFVQVCFAVQHAHQKGIIHRDLKPSNILVASYDDKPIPKVIDFGLAKAMNQALTEKTLHTAHDMVLGTPQYMSPEQATFNNLDIDTRSDVYSLGTLLYELLAGSPPFAQPELEKRGLLEILRVVREEEPQRPSLKLSTAEARASISANRGSEPVQLSSMMKGEIDWIVMKALEKDRTRRYDTATALAKDVQRYLNGDAVEACPPTLGYRMRKAYRRNRTAVWVSSGFAGTLFTILALVLYGVWWADSQARERRYERDLTIARDRDAIMSLLAQSEMALKAGRLPEASTLLSQIDERTDEQTRTELQARYEQTRTNEQTIRTLEDIFEERWRITRSDTILDNSQAKMRYPVLFQNYGLKLGQEPALQTVEKIRGSLISEFLATGLTEWFFVDPKHPGLMDVLNALDDNPTRRSVREIVFSADKERLSELEKTIDASQLTPVYAMGLGGEKVMTDVWKNYPDSFPLALSLSRNSGGEMERAVPWARMAVALRPDNALSHYQLAVAFDLVNKVYYVAEQDPAVEELERTIELAPHFARAHSKLAMLLMGMTRGGEKQAEVAIKLAERAIALDEKDSLAHTAIFSYYLRKEDYPRAALAAKGIQGNSFDSTYGPDGAYEQGMVAVAGPLLVEGLLKAGMPYEAFQFLSTWGHGHMSGSKSYEHNELTNAVKAAVLAGTGKGTDAPPDAERPEIRQQALKWMTQHLENWTSEANGVPSDPEADPDPAATAAEQKASVKSAMNLWLSDPDLARVRDSEWIEKLPADEQPGWLKLWSDVRTLRDQTSPVHTPFPENSESP